MQPASHPLKLKSALVALLAAGHLGLVFCSALHVPLFKKTNTTQAARLAQGYGQWTGASSQYSFFAPTITQSMRVSFDVKLDSGDVVHDSLQFENEAMKLRVYAMALRFNGYFGQDKHRDNMARAWAAAMFGHHPDARAMTIRVDSQVLPSMEQYASGERGQWLNRYRADVEFRPSPSPAQASNP